jgi:DNA-binding NarL/FixJ family response regulator
LTPWFGLFILRKTLRGNFKRQFRRSSMINREVILKILIVDDHPMMTDALATTLKLVTPGAHVIIESTLRRACVYLQEQPGTELCLLDLTLPDAQNFSGLDAVREQFPTLPVVVISADRTPSVILECLNRGAVGYVPKSATREVLMSALKLVSNGGIYVPPEAVAKVPVQLPSGLNQLASPNAEPTRRAMTSLGLTQRQQDVLKLILIGAPNKIICRELDLAEGTVKVHVSAVLRSLGAANRTQAVVAASRLGLRID